jgi:threonine-phosphate decarboxylase
MKEIIRKCADLGILLVVDECFLDFTEEESESTVKPYLNEYPNLFVLKAFTKIFAMPGIRLGYAFSSDEALLESIRSHGQPWSVSVLAEAAGIAALTDPDYVQRSKEVISEERDYLTSELNQLGLQTYASKSNYIFFRDSKKRKLTEALFTQGILIRSCANYQGLDASYWRIAVKDHREMRSHPRNADDSVILITVSVVFRRHDNDDIMIIIAYDRPSLHTTE